VLRACSCIVFARYSDDSVGRVEVRLKLKMRANGESGGMAFREDESDAHDAPALVCVLET